MTQEIPFPTIAENVRVARETRSLAWAQFRSCTTGRIPSPRHTTTRGLCCSALGQFLLPEAGDWASPIPMHPPEGLDVCSEETSLVLPFFFHLSWWIRGVESHPLDPSLPRCFHIQPGSSNHYNYGYHLGQILGWQGPSRRWLSPQYPPVLDRSDVRVCVRACMRMCGACTCVGVFSIRVNQSNCKSTDVSKM